ncbi:MAG: hypothetical protein NC418_03415 [Muribaculaceae bacterium]|nr:hypothetical protein [Muribaculaceae bacterium]
MTLKRYLLLPLALVAALMVSAAKAPTAASILAAMRAKLSSSPAVEAVFTINGGSGPVQGSVILAGSKYSMSTPQMSVWFDGKTQWTLLNSSREVSITEPSPDELMETNPFAILSAHSDYYTARRLSDSNKRYRVELVPRDKGSIVERFVVFVDPATDMPSALAVHFDDGRRIDVVIDRISAAKAKSAATFTFDAKKHPALEIIDLR